MHRGPREFFCHEEFLGGLKPALGVQLGPSCCRHLHGPYPYPHPYPPAWAAEERDEGPGISRVPVSRESAFAGFDPAVFLAALHHDGFLPVQAAAAAASGAPKAKLKKKKGAAAAAAAGGPAVLGKAESYRTYHVEDHALIAEPDLGAAAGSTGSPLSGAQADAEAQQVAEVAAKSAAEGLGDPSLGELLMQWYRAGYQTGYHVGRARALRGDSA